MCDNLSPCALGLHRSDIGIKINRGCLQIARKLSDPTDDVRHEFRTGIGLDFCQESRFEKGQLLKPDGVPDDQIQLFKANVGWPGVGRHRLTDDIAPLMLQAQFHQPRFKSKPFG